MAIRPGGINLEGLLKKVAINSGLVGQGAKKLTVNEKRKLKKAILAIAKQIGLNKEFESPDGTFNPYKIKQITSSQCEEVLYQLVRPEYNLSIQEVSKIVAQINSSGHNSSLDEIIANKLATIKERQSQPAEPEVQSVPPANGFGSENNKVSNVSSVEKRNRILQGLCQQEGRNPNERTGITIKIREAKDQGYFTQQRDTTKFVAALSKHIGKQNQPKDIATLLKVMVDSGDMRNIVEALGKLEKMEGVSAASLTKVVREQRNYSHLNSDTNGWDRVFKAAQNSIYDRLGTGRPDSSGNPDDTLNRKVTMRANSLYESSPRHHATRANRKGEDEGPNFNPSG